MRKVDIRDRGETIRVGRFVLDADLTIRFANRSFRDAFAIASEDAIGRRRYELGNRQWDIPKLRTCRADSRGWKSPVSHGQMVRCAIRAWSLLCGMAIRRRTSLNVTLTPELKRFISARVALGRYQTAGEAVRAALRLLVRSDTLEDRLASQKARAIPLSRPR